MSKHIYINRGKIVEILSEIIKIRHQLHRHPELSNNEHKTSEIVYETLKAWGYAPTGISRTGIYAILDSKKPGKTVALRADMDALPIQEMAMLAISQKIKG